MEYELCYSSLQQHCLYSINLGVELCLELIFLSTWFYFWDFLIHILKKNFIPLSNFQVEAFLMFSVWNAQIMLYMFGKYALHKAQKHFYYISWSLCRTLCSSLSLVMLNANENWENPFPLRMKIMSPRIVTDQINAIECYLPILGVLKLLVIWGNCPCMVFWKLMPLAFS